ncbi:MAG: hypothetical protein NTV34_20880 [Proteobacteria bacterium]|nr:hypothetical protein [Pseudomonadota bacterium]
MRTALLALVFFAVNLIGRATASVDSCAEESPPGMTCQCASLVEYKPSKHWDKFSEFVAGHLSYLKLQMQTGTLVLAGPFMDTAAGGTSIYLETDAKKLSQTLLGDPLLVNDVATSQIRPWMMCNKATAK